MILLFMNNGAMTPNVELSGRPLAAGPLQRRVGRLVDRETPEIGLRHSAK